MNGILPVDEKRRIGQLDVLRGAAVCAILPINILVMGTLADLDGLRYPAPWSLDLGFWIALQLFLEGASRGVFTLLFGAGMLLMLRKAEAVPPNVGAVDAWARRCIALLVFGVVQFVVFMWPGEILWNYGVAGFALGTSRHRRPHRGRRWCR